MVWLGKSPGIRLYVRELVSHNANHVTIEGGGGAGVNHVKRDWLEILDVNCDLYLFFCVKRDWGYLRET